MCKWHEKSFVKKPNLLDYTKIYSSFSLDNAEKELDFSPKIALRQGVKDYFGWFAKAF